RYLQPQKMDKKNPGSGGESGLRPLGVKQRRAVHDHLYQRTTWGDVLRRLLKYWSGLARFHWVLIVF
ncbi:hypothetical protein, partial [Pseudomonas fontis]